MQCTEVRGTLLLHSAGHLHGVAYVIELRAWPTIPPQEEQETLQLTVSYGDVETYVWLLASDFKGIPRDQRVLVAVQEGAVTKYFGRSVLQIIRIKQGDEFVPCYQTREDAEASAG